MSYEWRQRVDEKFTATPARGHQDGDRGRGVRRRVGGVGGVGQADGTGVESVLCVRAEVSGIRRWPGPAAVAGTGFRVDDRDAGG